MIEGDVTKRKFGVKEPEMMGCTLMGATLVGMMASFPHVKERVKHFDRELENNKIVMEALLSIDGTKILSEYPIGLTQLEEQTGRSKYKKDRE